MNNQLIIVKCLKDGVMIPYRKGIRLDQPGTREVPSDWIKEVKVGTPVWPLDISSDEFETVKDLIAELLNNIWKCPACGHDIPKLANACDACHMTIEYEDTDNAVKGTLAQLVKEKEGGETIERGKEEDSTLSKEVTVE